MTPPHAGQDLETILEQLQRPRLEAVRTLARTRQAAVDKRAEADIAEREDAEAYAAALRAGWRAEELKTAGYEAPGRSPGVRQRRRRPPTRQRDAVPHEDAGLAGGALERVGSSQAAGE